MAVTTGAKHVGFWTVKDPTPEFPRGEWVVTKKEGEDNPLCMCFAMSADGETTELFTGHQDGSIKNWVGSQEQYSVVKAHLRGVTQVVWTAGGLLSGGVDCKLKLWQRKKNQLEKLPYKIMDLKVFACNQRGDISNFVVPKSIDVLPTGQILLGTTSAQIFQVKPVTAWPVSSSDSPEVEKPTEFVDLLLDSHYRRQDSDSLHGVATYPVCGVEPGQANSKKTTRGAEPEMRQMFATCGPDHTWRLWNAKTRRPEFECGVEFERPSDGLVTVRTPACIDISPNGLLVALGLMGGGWCIYMDIDKLEGASKYVDRRTPDPQGYQVQRGWRQVYMTDTSEREARVAELKALEKKLAAVKADPYQAQHTDTRHSLNVEIDRLREVIATRNDFASDTPISVVRFAPNGFWLVVAARDGKMDIFSLKNLEVKGKEGDIWIPITTLHLHHEEIDSEAFLRENLEDAFQRDQERVERSAARRVTGKSGKLSSHGVTLGEIRLQGIRGEVRKVGQCNGHGTAVTHCDWSLDCRMLRSTSDTWELLFWDAPRGKQNPRPDEFRDVEWATNTVNFGWAVQGIWPVESDGSFVHAVDVSRGKGAVKVCATGDVSGHLKLFRYPCVGEQARFKSYIGHASHVKNLTFTQDNKYIISLGGHDCSILQWRYIPKFPDTLPTDETDPDLIAVAHKPSRFELQLKRRTYAVESAVSLRLILTGDSREASSQAQLFKQQMRVELADMLGASQDRVHVNFIPGPVIIADVTFALSVGGTDFVASSHYALELMKFVESSLVHGPSQKYLLLNKISSASLLADSENDDEGGNIKSKLMEYKKKETQASEAGMCSFNIQLDTDWHDVEQAGAFGNAVRHDIARAAENLDKLKARAGESVSDPVKCDSGACQLCIARFFHVVSVHKERDALTVDMKFINDPDQVNPGCEDLSGAVLEELSDQMKDDHSILRKGAKTQAVKKISFSSKEVAKKSIPLRLEIERAFGYNGGETCCNFQLLTAYYEEELERGKPETKVLKDQVQMMYTTGNLVVMEDCTIGKRPVQRFFQQHEEDISCIAVHPNGYVVASADAGAEPTIITWHSDTLAEFRRFSVESLEIHPTDNDYIGKTYLAGSIQALPTYGAVTRMQYVAAQLFVKDAKDGGIAKGVFLKVDKEIMSVEKVDGNILIVKRACQGTVASRHFNGAVVHSYQPTYRHQQSGGIAALAFTRLDWGKRLVSVSNNDTHTIVVYDTASGDVMQRAEAGREKILAVGTHPEEDVVVTCGVDHLVFWRVSGTKLRGDQPKFGVLGRPQTFLCVDFCYLQYQGYGGEIWPESCPGGIVTLTGSADGYIYIWEHNKLQKIVNMAHTGPIFDLFVPDVTDSVVLTAGQDGYVRMWNVADQTEAGQVMLADDRMMAEFCIKNLVQSDKHGKLNPSSRAGDFAWSLRNVRSFGDSIYVGTGANEIYELEFQRLELEHDEYGLHPEPEIKPRTAACGLSPGGSVVSVACHPTKLECVTTATGGCVRRWDIDWSPESATKRRAPCCLLAALCLKRGPGDPQDCLCVDYAPDGAQLAIGLNDGRVVVVDSEHLHLHEREVALGTRTRVRGIKFAPVSRDGALLLAVADENGTIDLVNFANRKIVSQVKYVASGGVPSLDWTHDAHELMTSAVCSPKAFALEGGDSVKILACSHALNKHEHLCSWSSTVGDVVSGLHAEDGNATGVTCAERFSNSKDFEDDVRGKIVGEWVGNPLRSRSLTCRSVDALYGADSFWECVQHLEMISGK